MDCRRLEYADDTFDLIIDKSTADALLCGSKAFKNLAITLRECQRVLKTQGLYIAISYGVPANRVFHFKRRHLKFDVVVVPIVKNSFGHDSVSLTPPSDAESIQTHYAYICKKQAGASECAEKFWEEVLEEIEQEEAELGYEKESSDEESEEGQKQ